jgi:Domain of unknown function (DUF1508)
VRAARAPHSRRAPDDQTAGARATTCAAPGFESTPTECWSRNDRPPSSRARRLHLTTCAGEVEARYEPFADAADRSLPSSGALMDDNGKNVASSGESFASKSNAKRAAENVKTTAAVATVGN